MNSIPESPGIYALVCSETDEVRYIGQSVNMKRRYSGHLYAKNHLPVSRWCVRRRLDGARPYMKVLKHCEKHELNEEEKKAIRDHRKAGCDLLNLQEGGQKPVPAGGGQGRDVWSLHGYKTPYMMFTQYFFPLCNNEKIRKRVREIRDEYRQLRTEPERLTFQLNCAATLLNILKGEKLNTLEEYLIKVAPKVNAKYPGRMTIVYNDGIEETPEG